MKVTDTYEGTIERVLFDADEIAAAIARLAREIAACYRREPLLILGVLKGALYVTADLARALAAVPDGPSEIAVDFLCVSSYGNQTRSSGEVRLLKDAVEPVGGRHVLVVEDIIDNGLTLGYLRSLLSGRNPASLRSCVLFDKPYHRPDRRTGRIRGTAGARRVRRRLRIGLPGSLPEPALSRAAPSPGLCGPLILGESCAGYGNRYPG